MSKTFYEANAEFAQTWERCRDKAFKSMHISQLANWLGKRIDNLDAWICRHFHASRNDGSMACLLICAVVIVLGVAVLCSMPADRMVRP